MVGKIKKFPKTFTFTSFSSVAAETRYERVKMAHRSRIDQKAKLIQPSGTPGVFARHNKS